MKLRDEQRRWRHVDVALLMPLRFLRCYVFRFDAATMLRCCRYSLRRAPPRAMPRDAAPRFVALPTPSR